MTPLKLNLGCGENRYADYVNVDKFGTPDLVHDLETLPWPWADNSVGEIVLSHVLEHLGHDSSVYLGIMKEMYRVCQGGARILIAVPHFRHDFFFNDPTHVRAVTPDGLMLFSQKANREWIANGKANSPLGLYLGVDFDLVRTNLKPSPHWFRLHPGQPVDMQLLLSESALYNNLIEEMKMELRVIKPAGSVPEVSREVALPKPLPGC